MPKSRALTGYVRLTEVRRNWLSEPGPEQDNREAQPGTWIPTECWSPDLNVELRVIMFPFDETPRSSPRIWDRNLSLIPER